MRNTLIFVFATALLASSCSSDDEIISSVGPVTGSDAEYTIEVDGNDILLSSSLSGFETCDELLDHLHTTGQAWVNAYGLSPNGFDLARSPVAMAAEGGFADDAMDGAATTGDVAESSYSETNTQEVNVDEADAIKTDGDRIYLVAAGQLNVIDTASRTVLGQIDIPTAWQSELFVQDDHVLLISSAWQESAVDDGEIGIAEDAIYEYGYGSDTVQISRYDIATDGSPTLIDSMTVQGQYLSSRSVDGVARVMVRSDPQNRISFLYPANEGSEDAALKANQEAIAESTLDQWLPSYVYTDANGTETKQALADCQTVQAPSQFAGFGVISLLNIALDGEVAAAKATEVLAAGSLVYGSTDSIYVATTNWFDPITFASDATFETIWNARRTSIHRFALSGDDAAYRASGSVPGDIRDQFSLSEYDNHLRVVTTSRDDDGTESFVRVLAETDGQLEEVGTIGNIGNGEEVQSVRMVGDVGYVVTFRQIDPFYTLDLSDPTNPQVVGELKIPGFSSYLHPIGNGKVMGVGSAADDSGRVTGAKVSLFDISDPANPQEVAVWDDPNGSTEVGWEHRSFLWWEAEQLAVVPVANYETAWAGAVVLKVNGAELVEVGRVDHIDADQPRGVTDCEVLTKEDLSADGLERFESEFQYLIDDELSVMLRCGPGDEPAITGYACNEDTWIQQEAARLGVVFDNGDYLVNCWDDSYNLTQISRSLVTGGDELWTVSFPWGYLDPSESARLQVNDLGTLERLAVVNVNTPR